MDKFQNGIVHEWEKRVYNMFLKISLKWQIVHNSDNRKLEILS
jgi:hypothetical protein